MGYHSLRFAVVAVLLLLLVQNIQTRTYYANTYIPWGKHVLTMQTRQINPQVESWFFPALIRTHTADQ